MKSKAGSVPCVSRLWWKEQGGIRSGEYTVCYSRGEGAEKGVAIVVHKSMSRRLSVTTESLFLR